NVLRRPQLRQFVQVWIAASDSCGESNRITCLLCFRGCGKLALNEVIAIAQNWIRKGSRVKPHVPAPPSQPASAEPSPPTVRCIRRFPNLLGQRDRPFLSGGFPRPAF